MKSITNFQNYKQLLLLTILSVLFIQTITTLTSKKSVMDASEEVFLEESSEKEELEYAVPMTNSTAPAKMSAEGWLKISSSEFRNLIKFPAIEINGNKFNIKTDNRNFRINSLFNATKKGAELPKSKLDFYFRLVNNLIYYTINAKDLNMLGTIEIISVKEKTIFLPGQELDGLCFQVTDKDNINWDMCADDKKTADNFICKIKTSLNISCTVNTSNTPSANKTSLETQIYQPVIVIPIPAKECNSAWDYSLKGNDWECGCSEGIEQSPIDIPEISNIIESAATPYFTFNPMEAKSPVTSIDGELKTEKHFQIKYFKNAIRILHNDIGKIVTLDGSVYIGEEIVFHTPAEHKINGKEFDMEMQVIFYGRSVGDIAKQVILSFLFIQKPGVYNKFLEDLDIFNLPSEASPEKDIKNELYVPKIFYNTDEEMELTVKPFSFYTYQGSLTMPPCSESTIHYVASNPIPIGNVVLQLFKEALKKENVLEEGSLENNRKTQPLNGRKVFYFDESKFNMGQIPRERPASPVPGHYERIRQRKTQFQWINNSDPSRFPGAMVVPQKEVEKILRSN